MFSLDKKTKIYIAGHRGLIGSAILREFKKHGFNNLIYKTKEELELRNQIETYNFIDKERPEAVILVAAQVGGIGANNSSPVQLIEENIAIQHNVIMGCHKYGISNLLFLSSSCIYPNNISQPMCEEDILEGSLDKSKIYYASAKLVGTLMCQAIQKQYKRNYGSMIIANVYGPDDNFNSPHAHVIPSMIKKFHQAGKSAPVTLWGSGLAKREFIYSEDVANACVFLLGLQNIPDYINIGTGISTQMKSLGNLIQEVAGHRGEIKWDTSKPEGVMERTVDIKKITTLGWSPKICLEEGLERTFNAYKKN